MRHALAAAITVTVGIAAASTGTAYAGDEQRDLERIARSGEALSKSRSAKFRGTTTSHLDGGADAKVSFNGRFDFANRAGEYSVAAESIGLQGDGKVRTLVVGGIVFLSIDVVEGTEIPGKKWLRLDPAVFGGEGQIGQSDPNGGLDALRGVTGEVENRGSEDVRGTRTMHYRVTIDPAKAVADAPEELRDAVRGAVRPLGSETIPADVWLDAKGRLRKVRLRVGSGSLASPEGSVAFEYYDLGAKVRVVAPPADEVIDFSEVLGGTPSS